MKYIENGKLKEYAKNDLQNGDCFFDEEDKMYVYVNDYFYCKNPEFPARLKISRCVFDDKLNYIGENFLIKPFVKLYNSNNYKIEFIKNIYIQEFPLKDGDSVVTTQGTYLLVDKNLLFYDNNLNVKFITTNCLSIIILNKIPYFQEEIVLKYNNKVL